MGDKYEEPYSSQVAGELAKKLFEQTDPLREGLVERGEEFLFGPTEQQRMKNPNYKQVEVEVPVYGPTIDPTSASPDEKLDGIPQEIKGYETQVREPYGPEYIYVEAPVEGKRAFDPAQSPVYDPMKYMLESGYQQSRENILANTGATGGQLDQMMAETETKRARDLGSLGSQLAMDEYNKIFQLATGQQPTSALGNLTNLGISEAGAAANAAAGKSAGTGSALAGIGSIIAAALIK